MKISWRRKNQERFKFSNKIHPKEGILGVIIALAVLIAIGTLFYLSSRSEGNSGVWIGSMGLALFFLSIIGFILSIMGFGRQDIYYRFPILGILLNGILGVLLLLLYIMGI